jgi:hypothetical protein
MSRLGVEIASGRILTQSRRLARRAPTATDDLVQKLAKAALSDRLPSFGDSGLRQIRDCSGQIGVVDQLETAFAAMLARI